MSTGKSLFIAFVISTGLAACASSSEPKRDPYGGADRVGNINKDMIVGQWSAHILNPIKGEETAGNPVVRYFEDGSVIVESMFDAGGMGMMEMEVSGNWTIKGDLIMQEATDVKEKSGSALGSFVKLFKGIMLKNANATLNVYEADSDRLVIVSDSGQAQELTRLK